MKHNEADAKKDQILAKSASAAIRWLGLREADLTGPLNALAARPAHGMPDLELMPEEREAALLLVRLCRALEVLVGPDQQRCQAWMVAPNLALQDRPADLLRTQEGQVTLLSYLDHMRAPVS